MGGSCGSVEHVSDLRLWSTGELLSSLAEINMEIAIHEHQRLLIIAELDRRGAAADLGYKDLPQVFKHKFRWDVRMSRQRIAHARLISREVTPTGSVLEPELSATGEAMAEGVLAEEHVAAVADVMKKLPAEAERSIVEFARQYEPGAVRSFGKELADRLDQDGPEPRDTEPKWPVNKLRKRWVEDQLEVWAKLDKVAGGKFETMLDPLAKPRPTTPEEGPDPRSTAEREGDAFAELIDLTLRADQLPEHGGESVTLTLTMRYEDLVEQSGQAALDTGEWLTAAEARKLACDAGVIPLVLGGRSQPMNIGRRTRALNVGIRRILVARDRGCAFPGCGRPPKHCDGHHIRHWADGGETSVANTVLLCRHHHTLIHRSEWEVTMRHGIPWFYPPAWLDPERRPRRDLLHAA